MANHTISANTLFHFTKSIDNLKNILTHTFSPRYCLEHIDIKDTTPVEIAIPMVCFCDIPLSQIKDHVDTYGEYAIGLSKDWAMSKGISPVLYLYRESVTNEMINRLFKSMIMLDEINSASRKTEIRETYIFFQLFFFCKDYRGNMWRNGKVIENMTFYNEREWRFVPNISELNSLGNSFFLKKEDFIIAKERHKCNKKIENIKISFTPKDIKYIIIKKESERLQMVRMIEQIKGSAYSMDDLKELNSKIISVEQIREDF